MVGITLAVVIMSPAAPTNSSVDPGSDNSHKRRGSEEELEAWGFPALWEVIMPTAQVTSGTKMSEGRIVAFISLAQRVRMELMRC